MSTSRLAASHRQPICGQTESAKVFHFTSKFGSVLLTRSTVPVSCFVNPKCQLTRRSRKVSVRCTTNGSLFVDNLRLLERSLSCALVWCIYGYYQSINSSFHQPQIKLSSFNRIAIKFICNYCLFTFDINNGNITSTIHSHNAHLWYGVQ